MEGYAMKALACLAVVIAIATAKPAWRDVSQVEDTAIVGSNLWEVAVSAPEDLSASGTGHGSHGGGGHHGGGSQGDQGFFKSKSTKGDNGYKSFDSFHKKDGDSYGYESHSAFGKGKGSEEAAAHQHATKYQEGDDEGHHRSRRQHDFGGHEGAGGGEHGGYEHHGVGEHSSDHHGGFHSEHHSTGGGSHHGGGGGGGGHHGGGGGGGGHHGGGGGGGHHGFF